MENKKPIKIGNVIAFYVEYPNASLYREHTIGNLISSGHLEDLDDDNEESILIEKNFKEEDDFEMKFKVNILYRLHMLISQNFKYYHTGEKVKIWESPSDGFVIFYYNESLIIVKYKEELEQYLTLFEKSLYNYPVRCFKDEKGY